MRYETMAYLCMLVFIPLLFVVRFVVSLALRAKSQAYTAASGSDDHAHRCRKEIGAVLLLAAGC